MKKVLFVALFSWALWLSAQPVQPDGKPKAAYVYSGPEAAFKLPQECKPGNMDVRPASIMGIGAVIHQSPKFRADLGYHYQDCIAGADKRKPSGVGLKLTWQF